MPTLEGFFCVGNSFRWQLECSSPTKTDSLTSQHTAHTLYVGIRHFVARLIPATDGGSGVPKEKGTHWVPFP